VEAPTLTCYRHPERTTGVGCQRCGRPICAACMTQASVGYHCPECLQRHAAGGSGVASMVARATDPIATKVLIALNAAAYVVTVVASGAGNMLTLPSGALVNDLGLVGGGFDLDRAAWVGVAEGEWWRLVTGGFLHAGLLHLGMNMLALWILGGMLEPVLGRARFVALYAASLLAGSAGVMVLDPNSLTVGASGAIFGLMGAAVALQRARGIDPWRSGLGGLVLVNLLITFGVPGISVGGHLGGLVGGALVGTVVFALERRGAPASAAVAATVALGAAFTALAVVAAGSWQDPWLGMLG
jgi:membrane associated rhomboid family serine protease